MEFFVAVCLLQYWFVNSRIQSVVCHCLSSYLLSADKISQILSNLLRRLSNIFCTELSLPWPLAAGRSIFGMLLPAAKTPSTKKPHWPPIPSSTWGSIPHRFTPVCLCSGLRRIPYVPSDYPPPYIPSLSLSVNPLNMNVLRRRRRW